MSTSSTTLFSLFLLLLLLQVTASHATHRRTQGSVATSVANEERELYRLRKEASEFRLPQHSQQISSSISTSGLQWTPDCLVEPQYLSYLGDGYCDALDASGPYNTAECGWDGGDCCASTCVKSKYSCPDQLFSQHCKSSMPTGQPTGQPTSILETVIVQDNLPDALSGVAWCGAAAVAINRKCNLRTAIRYCLQQSLNPICEIILPVNGVVWFDGGLFDAAEYSNYNKFIVIRGRGSVVTRIGSASDRFLGLNMSASHRFDLSIENLQFLNFGSSEGESGGTLRLVGLSSVSLENVTFQNSSSAGHGGAVYIERIKSFSLQDSLFLGNKAKGNGGGIYFSQASGSVSLTRSNFSGNIAQGSGGALHFNWKTTNVEVTFSNFFDNKADSSGGAVSLYVDNDSVTASDCAFGRNSAAHGGAVFLHERNDHVSFSRCKFMNNDASENGGAIAMSSNNSHAEIVMCDLTGNTAGGDGGGLYAGEGNVHLAVTECEVVDSVASSGGALFLLSGNQHFSMNRTKLQDNSATEDGGALYFGNKNSYQNIVEVNFNSNNAARGGGLFVGSDNSHISHQRCSFDGNLAESGGAQYIDEGNEHIAQSSCSFSGNQAVGSAGAIYVNQFNHFILETNCSFISNSASSYGGGIFFSSNNSGFEQTDCLMQENDAFYGGAIGIFSFNYNFHFQNGEYEKNVASEFGGCFHIASDNSNINILESELSHNEASTGGVMYVGEENAGVSLGSSVLSNNSAVTLGGAIYFSTSNEDISLTSVQFISNHASTSGGALYYETKNFDNIIIKNCLFLKNYCNKEGGGAVALYSLNKLLINNTQFINNSASDGGACSMTIRNTMSTHDSVVLDNAALYYGGGFFLGSVNTLEVHSAYVARNSAGLDGGGAFADINSELSSNTSMWRSNKAGRHGGGVYYFSNDLKIVSSSFIANEALQAGAGVYASGDRISVSKSIFKLNRVAGVGGSGGGLFVTVAKGVSIEKSEFEGNYVNGDGAAVSGELVMNVVLDHNSFRSNEAINGGALSFKKMSGGLLSGNNYYGNAAGNNGGAIMCSACSPFVINGDSYENNEALGSSKYSGGSALWLNATVLTFTGNVVVQQNRAPSGGGAVFWVYDSGMPEPDNINSAMMNFTSNSALFGSRAATELVYLQVNTLRRTGNKFNSLEADIQNVTLYQRPYVVDVIARDFYDQQVLSNSEDFIRVGVSKTGGFDCNSFSPSVKGATFLQLSSGLANFDGVYVSCDAGGYMTVLFEDAAPLSVVKSNVISLFFRTCNVGEYYRNGECRLCEVGFYSKQPNSDLSVTECEKCPAQAESCNGSNIVLRPGYWTVSESSPIILGCPMGANACPGGIQRRGDSGGGVTDESDSEGDSRLVMVTSSSDAGSAGLEEVSESAAAGCMEGYLGPLCGVCASDYYYHASSNACTSCEGGGFSGISMTIFIFLLLVLLTLVMKPLLRSTDGTPGFSEVWDADGLLTALVFKCSLCWKHNPEEALSFSKNISHKISCKIRAVITFLQILANLPSVLDLAFPDAFQGFTYLVGALSLRTYGLACAGDFDYVDYLFGVTIVSLMIICALLVCYVCLGRVADGEHAQTRTGVQTNIAWLAFSFLFLSLPAISCVIFRMFPCKNLDPDNWVAGEDVFLAADLSISCSSDRYTSGISWAILMVLFFPVGIPLLYLWQLYKIKDLIRFRNDIIYFLDEDRNVLFSKSGVALVNTEEMLKRDNILQVFQFLYWQYKPEYWYWEVVDVFRRMLLTGWLVLFSHGSTLQIIIGGMICLFFIKLYSFCSPFVDLDAAYSVECSLWQLFGLFYVALLLRDEAFSESRINDLDGALIAIVVLGFIAECFSLWSSWRFKDSNRQAKDVINMQQTGSLSMSEKDQSYYSNGTSRELVSETQIPSNNINIRSASGKESNDGIDQKTNQTILNQKSNIKSVVRSSSQIYPIENIDQDDEDDEDDDVLMC